MRKARVMLLAGLCVCSSQAVMAAADSDPPPPFQLADADGNGFIDQEEAARAGINAGVFDRNDRNGDARLVRWEYLRLEAGEQGQIAERFRALDSNGDGVLSRRELGEQPGQRWEELDRNSDEVLDQSEFTFFMEADG